MMFPDDYTLASGRAVKTMLESPSPEVDSECFSPRDTPEAPSPEQPNVQLVRYVRLGVPNKAEMANEAPVDGGRSVRQAISSEIPPDSETLTLKNALCTKSRRRSGNHGNNFEIPSTKDRNVQKSSNIEREIKEKWKRATSYASKKAKETMKPVNSDRDLESPFGAKWYPEVQHSYPKSESSVEELDDIEEEEALNCMNRIKYTKVGSRRHRGMEYSGADGLTPTEPRRIPDIEKIVQQQSVNSSSGRTVLQISGSAVPPTRAPITNTRARATISPLPTTEQLKAAKAVYNGYRPDSSSTCSGSGMTSGYSDMLACSPGIVDHWTREAEANPCSEYDELQPRFSWLKRSVAPFTAIAGAILVSVASM